VIALRLLCKEKIEKDDISCAFHLLNYFVMRFEKLYGIEHTTFKLHSLVHLAAQVLNFGPLHKHAVFHFEGNFLNNLLNKTTFSKESNIYLF
jgi:hypothetical protein